MKKNLLFVSLALFSFFQSLAQNHHGFLGKKNIVGIDPLSYLLNKRLDLTLGRISGNSIYELRLGIQPSNSYDVNLSSDDLAFFPSITNNIPLSITNSSYFIGIEWKSYLSSSGVFTVAPFGAYIGGGVCIDLGKRTFNHPQLNSETVNTITYLVYTSSGYGFRIGKSLLIEPSVHAGIGLENNNLLSDDAALTAIKPFGTYNANPLRVYLSDNEELSRISNIRFIDIQFRLKLAYLF